MEGGLFKVRRGRKSGKGAGVFSVPQGTPQPIWRFHHLDSKGSQVAGGDCGAPPSWTSPLGPHSHCPLPPWGPLASAPLSFAFTFSLLLAWSQPGYPALRQSTKVNASSVLGSMELGDAAEGLPSSVQTGAGPQDRLLPAHLEPLADTGRDFQEILSLFLLTWSCFQLPLRTHLGTTHSVTLRLDLHLLFQRKWFSQPWSHSRDGGGPFVQCPQPLATCLPRQHFLSQLSNPRIHR